MMKVSSFVKTAVVLGSLTASPRAYTAPVVTDHLGPRLSGGLAERAPAPMPSPPSVNDESFPVSGQVTIFNCSGAVLDLVDLNGILTLHGVTNANSGSTIHFSGHILEKATGVGETTGISYRWQSVGNDAGSQPSDPGVYVEANTTFIEVSNTVLTAPGSGQEYHQHDVMFFQFDAVGVPSLHVNHAFFADDKQRC